MDVWSPIRMLGKQMVALEVNERFIANALIKPHLVTTRRLTLSRKFVPHSALSRF